MNKVFSENQQPMHILMLGCDASQARILQEIKKSTIENELSKQSKNHRKFTVTKFMQHLI